MGVLDDAIREHIELKRQHGASEQDLARQEQEALGPARRETGAVQPAPEPDEEATDVLLPGEHSAAAAEGEAVEVVDEPAAAPAPEPGLEPELSDPEPELPDPEPELPDPEPELPQPEPESERALDREPEPVAEFEEDEDVLEETPEFLQETPEHDRLWFEQKPPRDFDFDE